MTRQRDTKRPLLRLLREKLEEDLHALHVAEEVRAIWDEDSEALEALHLQLARLLPRVLAARNMLVEALVQVEKERAQEDRVRGDLRHARLLLCHEARNVDHGTLHLEVFGARGEDEGFDGAARRVGFHCRAGREQHLEEPGCSKVLPARLLPCQVGDEDEHLVAELLVLRPVALGEQLVEQLAEHLDGPPRGDARRRLRHQLKHVPQGLDRHHHDFRLEPAEEGLDDRRQAALLKQLHCKLPGARELEHNAHQLQQGLAVCTAALPEGCRDARRDLAVLQHLVVVRDRGREPLLGARKRGQYLAGHQHHPLLGAHQQLAERRDGVAQGRKVAVLLAGDLLDEGDRADAQRLNERLDELELAVGDARPHHVQQL